MEMGTEVDGNYERRPRSAVLGIALAGYSEVVKEHAQWRHSDMKEKIDTQTREGPGASLVMDGGGPVLAASFAEECNRVSGQELVEADERWHADLARMANGAGIRGAEAV